MNRKLQERIDRLMPNGKPRWVRCYDNGGKTIDRYTIVFTNLRLTSAGVRQYPYVGSSADPFHPQGFYMHEASERGPVDRPAYGHLGKRIAFDELPAKVQRAVISDYKDYWELNAPEPKYREYHTEGALI